MILFVADPSPVEIRLRFELKDAELNSFSFH